MLINLKLKDTKTPIGVITGIRVDQVRLHDFKSVDVRYSVIFKDSEFNKRTSFSWETFEAFVNSISEGEQNQFVANIIKEEMGLEMDLVEEETQEEE